VGKSKVYSGHRACALNTTDLPDDNAPPPLELLDYHRQRPISLDSEQLSRGHSGRESLISMPTVDSQPAHSKRQSLSVVPTHR
jgi:hypothetical protein